MSCTHRESVECRSGRDDWQRDSHRRVQRRWLSVSSEDLQLPHPVSCWHLPFKRTRFKRTRFKPRSDAAWVRLQLDEVQGVDAGSWFPPAGSLWSLGRREGTAGAALHRGADGQPGGGHVWKDGQARCARDTAASEALDTHDLDYDLWPRLFSHRMIVVVCGLHCRVSFTEDWSKLFCTFYSLSRIGFVSYLFFGRRKHFLCIRAV